MSISNYGASQTLFSINDWGGQGTVGVGIGNDPSPPQGGVNWTFSNNGANYTVKNLIVLVGNPNTWTGSGSSSWSSSGAWRPARAGGRRGHYPGGCRRRGFRRYP